MMNKKQSIKPTFIFDSISKTPYSFKIDADCGHTIILSHPRTGKSFFGNSFLTKQNTRKISDGE